jgi:hypothetical protein
MAATNNLRPELPNGGEEDASLHSALQLRLVAGIVNKLIERNGGSEVANVFWDDHGELQMLGYDISERSVLRWMRKAPRSPDPAKRWAAFLSNYREVTPPILDLLIRGMRERATDRVT